MSRHKLVKSLDYDEELEDYDGGAADDLEEELTPEDRESLRRGLLEVRSTLGPDIFATDQEIEDSLYYYYYDVEKTVNYILGQKTKVKAQSTPKAVSKGSGPPAGGSISVSDYFHQSIDAGLSDFQFAQQIRAIQLCSDRV